jgi:hypothetical protein
LNAVVVVENVIAVCVVVAYPLPRAVSPPSVDADRHVPEIAKHPLVMLNPTLDVDVAKPEMFRPDRVVVPNPVDAIDREGIVVDENVVGLDVPIYSVPYEFLNVKIGSVVLPVARASCGAVDVATVSNHLGVPVPIPV